MDIENITIGQAKQIAALVSGVNCASQPTSAISAAFIGQTVIVRTYSAGVFCGTVQAKDGNEVILTNARRMWKFWCAQSISLSGVVVHGIDRSRSRIAPPVPSVWLEAIEILPISGAALDSIMGADNAKAQ